MQPLNDSSNLQQSIDALRAAKRPRLSQLEPAAATFATIVRLHTRTAAAVRLSPCLGCLKWKLLFLEMCRWIVLAFVASQRQMQKPGAQQQRPAWTTPGDSKGLLWLLGCPAGLVT
jgi:hypothetical protein